VSGAKTAEPIQIPFWALTHVGPRNHVLEGGQDWTNPFAAVRGDKTAMCVAFCQMSLDTCHYFHESRIEKQST